MSQKSASRLPLYLDSDLYFILPHFFISEFNYAKSLLGGVIVGQDPEFIHQYRVILRRIRSLCVLLGDIVSPFEQKLLKPNLKLLMKRTNLLRDLDVFLIDKPRYLTMLPEQKPSLENIFSIIKNRQINEHKYVTDWLQSRTYLNTSVMIENSFFRAQQYQQKKKPISPLSYANKKIITQFHAVNKSTKRIKNNSEDSIIHSTRIQCKSLRYLLESFSALYFDEQHKQNVKQLKFLQDQLGSFNDTSTQITFFTQLGKDVAVQKADRQTLKVLIREIRCQHERTRQSILMHINQFDEFLKEKSTLEIYRT